MRILVVGSGGREHALAWTLAASPLVDRVYCAPGNAGIAEDAECVPVAASDTPGLIRFCKTAAIDLTDRAAQMSKNCASAKRAGKRPSCSSATSCNLLSSGAISDALSSLMSDLRNASSIATDGLQIMPKELGSPVGA